MRMHSLDELLPLDHRARIVWKYVESLDLEPLYAKFKAVQGTEGRPAIAPEILLGLWLLAVIESISSARELARRCTRDLPYMWICGDVSVNYHTLSDFRSNNAEFFEKVMVDTVTAMLNSGLITLETVGHDGMRVRANAGSSSFRREPTLKELHQQAQEAVDRMLEDDDDDDDSNTSAGSRAARERAIMERESRIAESLRQVEELRDQKEKRKKGDGEKARCSTTDPDARKMKMGDGGTRPAYNFQLTTDAQSRMVVGVDVLNSGSDRGKLGPVHDELQRRYGRSPLFSLVDSAFATKADVTKLEKEYGTEVVSTVYGADSMSRRGKNPYERQRGDTDEYASFRQRMAREDYREFYKQRPSIAEYPNAEFRNRGCQLLLVRGLQKVRSVALLFAAGFNLLRMISLRAI